MHERGSIMKKLLEQRAMILLISFTFLAYLLKTVSENVYGNVFVTVVNMALLWNIASNYNRKNNCNYGGNCNCVCHNYIHSK